MLHHALDQPFASTKSAPHRSGDRRIAAGLPRPLPGSLNEVRSPQERRRADPSGVVRQEHASTKSAPHRSGDRAVRLLGQAHRLASTKSAPHRSGDARSRGGRTRCGCRLNEVRSPQERRRLADQVRKGDQVPQRSPLPTGAGRQTVQARQLRRASTKSAPHRSGDNHGRQQGRRRVAPASTKSAPHRSGDSTSDYSPLTWADATFGEPWAQEASVERHAYRPRPMNRGLTSPFLMRRLAGFRTSTEPSRRSLARFR